MELAKDKIGHFLYRLNCRKGIFFNICVLSQCIVYWIFFQNIRTFSYQKTLLHTLLLLAFKVVESLQCILKQVNFWISLSPKTWLLMDRSLELEWVKIRAKTMIWCQCRRFRVIIRFVMQLTPRQAPSDDVTIIISWLANLIFLSQLS